VLPRLRTTATSRRQPPTEAQATVTSLTQHRNWPDAGPLAYLATLIENLRSGAWRENCREYEGRQP